MILTENEIRRIVANLKENKVPPMSNGLYELRIPKKKKTPFYQLHTPKRVKVPYTGLQLLQMGVYLQEV